MTRGVTDAGGPFAEPSAAIPGTVRHRVTGEVMSVERHAGTVRLRTPDGADVAVTLPPFSLATVREGDRVTLDVVITPR